MKSKLTLLCVFTALFVTLCSCTEKITCKITSPKDGADFSEYQSIPVSVEASVNKGTITHVEILIDDSIRKIITEPPYDDMIAPKKLSPGKFHSIAARAYSSGGHLEGDAIYIMVN